MTFTIRRTIRGGEEEITAPGIEIDCEFLGWVAHSDFTVPESHTLVLQRNGGTGTLHDVRGCDNRTDDSS